MRRGLILFVGILALALAPTFVGAQYSGAFGLSGLPSMPSMFGGSGKCGDAASPAIAPAFYVGWNLRQEGNTKVSLIAHNTNADISEVHVGVPTSGLWLGAALPVSLGDNLSFVATGWYLFGVDDSVQSGVGQNILIAGTRNNWQAKPNWWFVDGALAYGWSGFAALIGLRYDNYTVSLSNPNNTVLFTGQQETDFLSSAWIPFIGFQSAYTDTIQSLKFRILGIPTILGYSNMGATATGGRRFEYKQSYSAGGFFEIFAEYSRKFFGSSQAGGFVRWNTTRALSSGAGVLWNNTSSAEYDFSLNRTSLTIGALMTLDFNTPF